MRSLCPRKRKGFSAILNHCLSNGSEDQLSYEERVDREVKRCDEYPPADMNTDPLTRWKDKQKNFSALESLACKYL